ncbi:hypothetical protein FB446DRAFT_754574 [Lentinula raphanica]|nr:hypothetical protein FB446DRAFT_754574 [Lentinula raphanica]
MKLVPIAGIVYLAFGFLTTTAHGAPFPSNAIVTERKPSEAKALSIADDGAASSLVRRKLQAKPSNVNVNAHGDPDPDSGLDLNDARSVEPDTRVQRIPAPNQLAVDFEVLVWFNRDERPQDLTRRFRTTEANVYPGFQNQILSAVNEQARRLQSATTLIIPQSEPSYLEHLPSNHPRFHFQFFYVPRGTNNLVSFGDPFHRRLVMPTEPVPHHPSETHIWFTDAGRQLGPHSEIRLPAEHTGLSAENVFRVFNTISTEPMDAMDLPIVFTSGHITVFRERWREEDRQFHWQTFRRDQDGNLVERENSGPYTDDLCTTRHAPPRTGGNGHGAA